MREMIISRTVVLVAVLAGLLAETALAVNIETVPVGNPGNAGELSGSGAGGVGPDRICGSVGYAYNIGKYEVTNGQYAEFLNAVDANGVNPYSLYRFEMGTVYYAHGGISFSSAANPGSKYSIIAGRGNMPVNWVSFWDACRFANWVNNGQGTGSTETGAYSLNGVTNPTNTITRNPGARVFIPSEDEWYKAAYHKSGSTNAGYWDYATQSNTAPQAEPPPGIDLINGSANYAYAVGDLTNVGSYTAKPSNSAYGTFDQGGSVWEWNDTVISGSSRGLRGGSFFVYGDYLRASYRGLNDPTYESGAVGFRVAEVPEPTSFALLAMGALGMPARRRGLGR